MGNKLYDIASINFISNSSVRGEYKKVRNQYYFSISIKGTSLSKLKEGIREAPIFRENNIIIDVDPI